MPSRSIAWHCPASEINIIIDNDTHYHKHFSYSKRFTQRVTCEWRGITAGALGVDKSPVENPCFRFSKPEKNWKTLIWPRSSKIFSLMWEKQSEWNKQCVEGGKCVKVEYFKVDKHFLQTLTGRHWRLNSLSKFYVC